MDFRTAILKEVHYQLYSRLVIQDQDGFQFTSDDPAYFGLRIPKSPDDTTRTDDNRDGNPYPESPTGGRWHTPLWQVVMRPVTPEDVRNRHLLPSAFLQVVSGQRSRSGRGLPDSPIRSVLGDMTEAYTIGVTGVFSQEQGAKSVWVAESWDAYVFQSKVGGSRSLTEQVNGWIWDLDEILNVRNLRESPRMDLPPDVTIAEAYLQNWETRKGFKGSPTEIVLSELVVTINYGR